MTNEKERLADLLLPAEGGHDPAHYERLYGKRDLPQEAYVTRLGPSPTGFAHLGNLFMAFVNMKLAAQSGGVFFLRIEDTDREREVEGAVPMLISALDYFGIAFDEGVRLGDADGEEVFETGDYGPYFQSHRKDIYHSFARELILAGKAYPCFLTEEEITSIREEQERGKLTPGIYGEYARYRGVGADEAAALIGEGRSYVIRFNADWAGAAEQGADGSDDAAGTAEKGDGAGAARQDATVTVHDAIRGELTLPKNIMDVVVLKSDGLPTYHFAHAVDDHLMRTTHVVRGEEWISSLPVHVALFDALGLTPPTYCHTALLMKTEDGKKRKLSKRLDPELALSYYIAEGYHPRAIEEYMLTIINSNYEEWRLANREAPSTDFVISTEKMGVSGILFDLDKLSDISKDVLVQIPAEELAAFMLDWAGRERADALPVLEKHFGVLLAAIDVGRTGDKPRKDLAFAGQIFDFISFYFDEWYEVTDAPPEHVPADDIPAILGGYLASYDHADDRDIWFGKIRTLATELGYAAKPKDYKKDPDSYKGHVGDVSAVIRLALTGRKDAPDIWEVQQAIGEESVRARLSGFAG